MTRTNAQHITHGQAMRLTSNGIRVQVIGIDSDPRCDVLVVDIDDPDRSYFVQRDELAPMSAPSNRWKNWPAR